jgi:hypothetical protein
MVVTLHINHKRMKLVGAYLSFKYCKMPGQLSQYSDKARGWKTEELWFNSQQG